MIATTKGIHMRSSFSFIGRLNQAEKIKIRIQHPAFLFTRLTHHQGDLSASNHNNMTLVGEEQLAWLLSRQVEGATLFTDHGFSHHLCSPTKIGSANLQSIPKPAGFIVQAFEPFID